MLCGISAYLSPWVLSCCKANLTPSLQDLEESDSGSSMVNFSPSGSQVSVFGSASATYWRISPPPDISNWTCLKQMPSMDSGLATQQASIRPSDGELW